MPEVAEERVPRNPGHRRQPAPQMAEAPPIPLRWHGDTPDPAPRLRRRGLPAWLWVPLAGAGWAFLLATALEYAFRAGLFPRPPWWPGWWPLGLAF